MQGTRVFHHPAIKGDIILSGRGIKELLNQPHRDIALKNEALLHLDELIREGKYIGELRDKKSITVCTHLIEIQIANAPSWLIIRQMNSGMYMLYSITDSPLMKTKIGLP